MEMEYVVAAIGIAVAAVTSTLGFLFGRRESQAAIDEKKASAAASIAEAYNKLNDALDERITSLEKERRLMSVEYDGAIEELRLCIEELDKKVELLEAERASLLAENKSLRDRIRILENGYGK